MEYKNWYKKTIVRRVAIVNVALIPSRWDAEEGEGVTAPAINVSGQQHFVMVAESLKEEEQVLLKRL